MSPLEDTIVALRPIAPRQPFGIPDSIRPLDPTMPIGSTMGFANIDPYTGDDLVPVMTNQLFNFGWEYVWHCHILSHEEMDMMRPMTFHVDRLLPAAPVADSTVLGGKVNVTWTDATPASAPSTWGNPANEIGFRIERANGANGAFGAIGTALANATSYIDSTAVSGRGYRYRVVAFNAAGSSTSNIATVGIAPTLPVAPTNLAATAIAPQRIDLTWSDRSDNETGFAVQRATNAGFTQRLRTVAVGANVTAYTDTAVQPNTRYYYRVRALNTAGSSAWSNAASATTPRQLPTAPTNLKAALAGANRARLSWTDNAANETGFTIQRATNAMFTGAVQSSVPANITTIQQARLNSRVTYYFRIRANGTAGSSEWSNIAGITIP